MCDTLEDDHKGSSRCDKEGVCYSIKCQACPKGKGVYIGETSSTAFTRGQQHLYQLKLHKEGKLGGKESVLGRHIVEDHNSKYEDVSWAMKVETHHLGQPHQRQCHEKVYINEYGTINTRTEQDTDRISQAASSISRGHIGQ